MATATQVMIKVVVDGKDAGPAIDGINQKLGEIGIKGSASLRQAGHSLDQVGGHAARPLDAVRLLSQEFGLRLPRAIEAMLSRMPAVTNAIMGVVGGLAAIAAIEVFAHMIEGAKQAYDQFISLNAVIDKYNEGVEKARQADLPNARSIETAQLRLRDQTHVAYTENATAEQLHAKGMTELKRGGVMMLEGAGVPTLYHGIQDLREARKHAETATNATAARDQLAKVQALELTHEQKLHEIDLKYAGDAALTQKQQELQKNQRKKDIAAENRTYDRSRDLALGNEVDPAAGVAAEKQAIDAANAEYGAQEVLRNRETSLANTKSRHAAVLSGMSGEELFAKQMRFQKEEVAQELGPTKPEQIGAKQEEIFSKYYYDASERAVKGQQEFAARDRQQRAEGLTGAARIYADQESAINQNNTKYQGDERSNANIAAKQAANQKLEELERQFAEQMDGIEEGRVNATLSGYARIDAEARKTADQIRESFEKSWGGADVDKSSQQYIAARKSMQNALTAVDASAEAERQQLRDQMAEETLRYDQQAAQAERQVKRQSLLGWGSDYQSAVAEIRAQEEARERDLQNQLKKGEVDWENYTQRMKDVHTEASAQVLAQQQQLQHQVAGELQQAFTDPLQFIKQRMEQMFFEVIAQWLMQLKIFKQLYGQTMGGLQAPGAGRGGLFGGLGIAGTRGTFGGNPTLPAEASGGGVAAVPAAARSFVSAGLSGGGDTGASIAVPSFATTSTSTAPSAGAASAGVEVAQPQARTGVNTAGTVMSSISDANSLVGVAHTGYAAISTRPTTSTGAPTQPGIPSVAGGGPDITPTHNPQPTLPSANGNGSQQSGGAAKTMNAAGAAMTIGTAAYEGYGATKDAYESDSIGGTFKGAAQDAMAGAAIGMVVGGPVGALVGAGIGALVGLTAGIAGMITGQGPRLKAREYYRNTLFPEIESIRNSDTADFQTAISNVNRIASDGMSYMSQHFGSSAAKWVDDNYLKKEQNLADAQLEARAKGGAYAVQMSAAQFHTGGRIRDFGDLATGYREGFIHAELGEGVVRGTAMAVHGPAVDAMNSGASPADIAKMYLASTPAPSGSGSSGRTVQQHITIQALDSKSLDQAMKGGGAKVVQRHLNALADSYAGDAAHG